MSTDDEENNSIIAKYNLEIGMYVFMSQSWEGLAKPNYHSKFVGFFLVRPLCSDHLKLRTQDGRGENRGHLSKESSRNITQFSKKVPEAGVSCRHTARVIYGGFFSFAETISKSCDTLFEDVVDDFHDLHQIKSRFEEWRSEHSDSYNEAYIGLCLPKLLAPFVRLGLITWNPLQVTQT